jgi:glycosyltransferase involved in cell wall biosynthesis
VPVVATRGGGVDEIVTDESNGLLTDFGDDRGIAKAIARLIGDSSLARRLANAGRETAERRFTPEQMVERATQFFEAAAARRRLPE